MLKKAILLFSLIIATSAITSCSQATPQEQVRQTINKMITALEDGDKALIFEQYALVPPNRNLKLSDFSDRHANDLLKYLKSAKDITPIMSDNNTTATIRVSPKTDNKEGAKTAKSGTRTLTFTKVDGQWKVNN